LEYTDPLSGEKYLPHVIEPSMGVDRTLLAVLLSAYTEIEGGRSTTTEAIKEAEVVLRLPKELAPVKIAILPLSKKEELSVPARELAMKLRKRWVCQYDESGSIGKRYRRQDEIGTPCCLTFDFDTLNDQAVTIRDRDTMAQERIAIADLEKWFIEKLEC
jgi:glycyl-tRNA synthetase